MAINTVHCPRCGRAFHCGVHDAQPCACTTVRLSDDQLSALQREFSGCLCLDCLRALAAAGAPASAAHAAHAPPPPR